MNEKNTIQDRIQELINHFGKNKRSFALMVGTSDVVIGNIVAGRRGQPSYDLIEKIIQTIANINIEWLITGAGNMFKSVVHDAGKVEDKCIGKEDELIKILKTTIKAQESTIKSMELTISLLQRENAPEITREKKDKQLKHGKINS